MKIEIVITGLLEAGATAARAPTLEALLARGRTIAVAAPDLDAWLLEAWGLPVVEGAPVAAWCLLGEGRDPGDRHWLRMDPVHLVADRSSVLLAPLPPASLAAEEAAALAATLRDHIADLGAELLAPDPQRWYLGLAAAPAIATVALTRAAGVLDGSRLPTGPDSAAWRRLLTEFQMLLHEHPVNARREAAGQPAINAVWLWGGPHAPVSRPAARGVAVWSDSPLARGLARAGGDPAHGLPASAADVLAGGRRGSSALIALDAARIGPRALEHDWIAPLHAALGRGEVGELRLVLLPPGRALGRHATRSALHKWWRRTRALGRYV